MHLRAEPKERVFRNFAEFYPFYLSEHHHPVSRTLHYLGTWGTVICVAGFFITGGVAWITGGILSGYGFAWLGHFRFERNKPATFRHPFYSLAGDFRMWWELNLGKLRFRE